MSLGRRTLLAGLGLMLSACQKRTPTGAVPPSPAPQAPAQAAETPPAPQGPKPARPAPKGAGGSQPAVTAPSVAPAPRLTEMLSAEDQRRYNQQIDQDLRSARENLAKLPQRRTENQKALATQVAGFIQQAEALRRTDPITARGFAQKASVLAREAVAATP